MSKTFADYGITVPYGQDGEVYTLCPQCSQTRRKKKAKCLAVNTDKGCWICIHCGWVGGLGKDRPEPMEKRKPVYRRPQPKLESGSERVIKYLSSRGITEAVIDRNKVSFARVYMPQVEDTVDAVAFPYYRSDDLINCKYRDSHKNFRLEKGAERILYGLNDIREACVIVEGEIDKLSCEVAGYSSCVSVPDGAPSEKSKNYAGKFSFIESDQEILETVEEWIIAVDNDPPGKRLEEELARRFGRDKCKRVTWPEGCKDANDVLTKYGPDRLREVLDAAEPFPVKGVVLLDDLSEDIDTLYQHGGWEAGLDPGWREVERLYTVRPGQVTVVTGIPGSGKSNWVDALSINLARQYGWQFAMFSPENTPLEDHAARLCEKYTKVPFFKGPTTRMGFPDLQAAKQWVRDHYYWILPSDDAEWTLGNILESARGLLLRKGINGLVIDPWNEVEHCRPREMTQTEYIGRELRRIRQFARSTSIHVWVVAHPAKLYRDKSSGQYPVPSLYDISDSANWRNKCDNGIVVWRDFKNSDEPVQIHVQKVRFRQDGRIGMAKLEYVKATATYRDIPFLDHRHVA